jgi:hypothetical protein
MPQFQEHPIFMGRADGDDLELGNNLEVEAHAETTASEEPVDAIATQEVASGAA